MNTTHRLVSRSAVILLISLLTGCISLTKTSYRDAPRTPVQFASPPAEQIIYDAILARQFPAVPPDGNYRTLSIFLTPPFWYNHPTKTSGNVVYNEAVAAADTNHDGIITEDEARAYAKTQEVKQVAETADTAKM